ncbi:unnamed protein product [Ilex paraguariensis]|uniref:Homeobox-leucine zipper protein n=1 Tax=Ilex paraguariensis TaxID=185542 RepID=A0ABC8R2P3_9AQUA
MREEEAKWITKMNRGSPVVDRSDTLDIHFFPQQNNERERERGREMTTSMHHQVDDQMTLISQYYPDICSLLVPEQGQYREATKPRRRRKKSKGEASSSGVRKRKLSHEQVDLLEKSFGNEHKLESGRKDRIASELGLDPRQVAVWFQNRRAKWKSKNLQEAYSKLKTEHEGTVIEKCRLETELGDSPPDNPPLDAPDLNTLLKLKEQLSEAQGEIQKLLERCDGVSSNSPSSSFSMEVMEPPFLGEFGMEGLENVPYVTENNYIHGLMEWLNLCDM